MAVLGFGQQTLTLASPLMDASRNGAKVAVAVHQLMLPGRSSGAEAAAAEAAAAAAALRLRLKRKWLFVILRLCCGLPLSRLLVAVAALAARLRRLWQLPYASPRAAWRTAKSRPAANLL